MNAAQRLHALLGVAVNESGEAAKSNKNESATKRGPGREHAGGKPGNRLTKQRPQRAYMALMQAAAQKRITNWKGPRDSKGVPMVMVGRTPVYSESGELIGSERRFWLGGISAQRGY